MDIQISYEASEELDIDYEKILDDIISEVQTEYGDGRSFEVSVTFVDNDEIHAINKEYRNIDSPTDVLSFPMSEFEEAGNVNSIFDIDDAVNPDTGDLMLGDIILSVARIKSQAEEYGHSTERECAFLVAHSMLHLLGFDHMEDEEREDMFKRQEEILSNKGYVRN